MMSQPFCKSVRVLLALGSRNYNTVLVDGLDAREQLLVKIARIIPTAFRPTFPASTELLYEDLRQE